MRKLTTLAASAAILGAAFVWTGPALTAPLPDAVPARVFAAPETMEGAKLSPDGTRIAAKMLVGGKMQLIVTPVGGGNTPMLAAGELDINWWRWASNDRLLIGIGDTVGIYGQDAYVTRVASVGADLKGFKAIDWEKSGQFADDVIYVPSDGSSKILLSKQTGFDKEEDYDASVFEADMLTGKTRLVLGARGSVRTWYADGKGNIRLGVAWDENRKKNVYHYRAANGQDFKTYDDDGSLPFPAIFLPDGSAIGFSDKDGYDAVYEIALPSFTLGKKLFSVPGYDVGAIRSSQNDDAMTGVTYVAKRVEQEYFDPTLKMVKEQVDKAVGRGNGRILSASRDHTRVLVELGEPNQAGGLYFWDVKAGGPRLIAWNNEHLKDRALSPVRTIEYKARDGTRIEAVLTVPRGRPAKNLPLIVLPHGGPGARDVESFDWWTQYLAELGYAVIQPNYRGSTGYGVKFHELAEGQFGTKMQDDLLDAITWAASQGIADPKRVCIAGASYGGYAAMRGAQRDGSAYRCAISFAGVSDLKEIMKYDRQFLIGTDPKKYWRNLAPDFNAVSPRYHAADFKVPMLIMHGAKDKRVPIKQSRLMVDALKRAGKPVVYIEQKEGDHHFSREADRLQFLEAMKTFLDKYNPA